MTRDPQHVVIGNPANRRVGFFQQALARFNLRPAVVIPYRDLIGDCTLLQSEISDDTIVRIESPGEDETVTRHLIARGAASMTGSAEKIGVAEALALETDLGRIRFLRQWYLGYQSLLNQIQPMLEGVAIHNHPDDIQLMFDKPACQQHLADNGIPVPPMLSDLESFAELLATLSEQKWSRVFVKPAHGSSASGVVAFYFDGDCMRAVTPIEMVRSNGEVCLYNNLRLTTYREHEDIEWIVNFLIHEGAQIERWLPKAGLQGRTFDLRILVIAGKACHVVMRTSQSPITNLHLGNQRGDLDLLRQRLSDSAWQDICQVAEQAAAVVKKSLYVGVDLMLHPGNRNPTVLELNAFGDLLPNVLFNAESTYEAEIRASLEL